MHSSLQTFPIACVTPSQSGLIYSADSLASQYLTLMDTNLCTYLLYKYFMVLLPHRADQRSALPSGCWKPRSLPPMLPRAGTSGRPGMHSAEKCGLIEIPRHRETALVGPVSGCGFTPDQQSSLHFLSTSHTIVRSIPQHIPPLRSEA